MFGIPIIENPHLPDDRMFISSDGSLPGGHTMVILVGTQPPDPIKQAGRDARQLVRRGLADVLEWLGEDVETEPLMTRIRNLSNSGKRGLPPWFQAPMMPSPPRLPDMDFTGVPDPKLRAMLRQDSADLVNRLKVTGL